MIPHRTPFFLPLMFPALIWRIPSDKKEIYLTFDDGPVDGPTSFVLEKLEEVKARATFFCIGDNVRKNPDVFQQLNAGGHTVGNHTFNHVNGWKSTTIDYVMNIRLNHDHLVQNGARVSSLFRPPYGRITLSQMRALRQYKIVMWDVLSRDFDKGLSPDKCLRNTLRAVRPGSIVVFHDSFKAERNLQFALPRLLESLSSDGYSFKTLPS